MLQIKQHILRHFGIERLGEYTDDTINVLTRELSASIEAKEMAALIGPYGSGKSHIVRRVRCQIPRDKQPKWVHVRDMTPRRTKLQNIINAIIADLSDESLRANFEFRSRQCERLLGRWHSQGRPACVVIDDAHRLTSSSLSGLKRLREAEFNGESPLLSIVLVGWPELGGMLQRRRDIAWRTSQLRLSEHEGYMTHPKRVGYLQAVFQDAIAPKTRRTIATLGKRPEAMNRIVKEAMQEAYHAGYEVVDERTVQPTLEEMKEALEVSFSEIADEAGVSATTAHRRVHNPQDDEHTDAVSEALDRIAARKSSVESLAS